MKIPKSKSINNQKKIKTFQQSKKININHIKIHTLKYFSIDIKFEYPPKISSN